MVTTGAVGNLERDGQPGFAVAASQSNFLISAHCIQIRSAPGMNGEDPR